MPATPLPSLRLVNVVIAILGVCSVGALIEGTGCDNVRFSSCRMFADFFSHLPLYIIAAVVLSEFVSWGLLGRVRGFKAASAKSR